MRIPMLAATALTITSTTLFAASDEMATKDVVMTHLRAFGALDIDALLATYSDDAEVVTPARVFTGPAEIREFLEPLVAEFSQDGISMETETIMFGSDTGFVVWHAESPDNVYDYAAETYFVDDGKIVSHSYAAKVTPK